MGMGTCVYTLQRRFISNGSCCDSANLWSGVSVRPGELRMYPTRGLPSGGRADCPVREELVDTGANTGPGATEGNGCACGCRES